MHGPCGFAGCPALNHRAEQTAFTQSCGGTAAAAAAVPAPLTPAVAVAAASYDIGGDRADIGDSAGPCLLLLMMMTML